MATGNKVDENAEGVSGDNNGPRVEATGKSRAWLLWPGLLALMTLAVFGRELFAPGNRVLSNGGCDIHEQFIHWRAFGFSEMRHGNLPLWDPHLYSGAPFLGGFQSALLYPPNLLFVFLPVGIAVNWSIALHVFLAGAFTFAWAAKRGLRPPACFLAATIFMFCGAHFPQIYAGHLPNLCALVWAPLLFLAIDGLYDSPSLSWSLLGMFALAMQVLAGHPQYVFYTGVAAGLYCILCLIFLRGPHDQMKGAGRDVNPGSNLRARSKFLLGMGGMLAGGVALSAMQLFTGLYESRELARQSTSYEFAALFSFAPENVLTLFAPYFFGGAGGMSYWGRCYLWEMCLFIGVTGVALAALGAIQGDRRARRFSIVMIVFLFWLALGAHTPLFKLLYHWAPGFSQFRGSAKFIFLASLFLAMLAGIGFDELLKGCLPSKRLLVGALVAALLMLSGALALYLSSLTVPAGWWRWVLLAIQGTGELFSVGPEKYQDQAFALRAARAASVSLFISGATLFLVTLLLFCVRKRRLAPAWLLAPAVAELFVFGCVSLDSFDLSASGRGFLDDYLKARPGDYRVYCQITPDTALSTGSQDVWGYDPAVLGRYARLFAFTQGVTSEALTIESTTMRDHPLLAMLRCRFIVSLHGPQAAIFERADRMPQLSLVNRYRMVSGPDAAFAAVTNATFNPREEVILEESPGLTPGPGAEPGEVRLIGSSTDSLDIEARINSPCILLITDAYARGWRARALSGGGSQREYRLLPADYCLRGIPLDRGEHHLRLEYKPLGYVVGRWVSIIALLAFAGLVFVASRAVRRSSGRR